MTPNVSTLLREQFPKMLTNAAIECNNGWAPLLAAALTRIQEVDKKAKISTIKEQLGGLRIYFNGIPDDAVYEIVTAAEQEAEVTCDICGRGGRMYSESLWLRTRCTEHINTIVLPSGTLSEFKK